MTKPSLNHHASSFSTSGVTTPSIVLPPELIRTPSTSQADLSSLDLSLPLSTLLKSGTKLAHANAEHSAGAIALATGTLELSEYVRYLTILWMVYQVLETELDRQINAGITFRSKDGSVDALEALWSDYKGKGKMLRRSHGLATDITYYLSYLGISGTDNTLSHIPFPTPPLVAEIISTPPSDLEAFLTQLKSVSHHQPGLLLAHAYVRYLGDLSGGQLVAAKIRRVYSLPPPPAGGTAFYEFDLDGEGNAVSLTKNDGLADEETLFERKKKVEGIKNWFRDCMDFNVGDDEALKAQVVQEAITCFHHSTKIFSLLRPPVTPPPTLAHPGQIPAPTPTSSTPHQRKPSPEEKTAQLGNKLNHMTESSVKTLDRAAQNQGGWYTRFIYAVLGLLVARFLLGLVGGKGEDLVSFFGWA